MSSTGGSSGLQGTTTHDERRLFEHFVIAGLDETKPLEHLTPSNQECGLRNTQPLAPIVDITVIFPDHGEKPPEGFEVIEITTLGYPADLNHGSIRTPSCFLCYRRGYHKFPLVDITILDEGDGDKPMVDSNIVQTTPYGRPANVNNTTHGIYLTYRRAAPDAASSQFVVTDIKVILENKGEIAPHTYYKIPKKLNKGIIGSDVYICYKKSQGVGKRLAYKPAVLDYFPRVDRSAEMEDFKLAQNVAMFCLPMGALIECWQAKCSPPDRSFSTFVLTDENGTKFYGSAVTFYERYNKKLTENQLEYLDLKPDEDKDLLEGGTVDDSTSNNDPADDMVFFKNVSICLISRYPFFNSFKRFLFFLHRMSSSQNVQYTVPIERYISHLMHEVSFPTPRRPRVFMQLGAENISFDSHDDSQLPLNGAQLLDTLKFLGAENLMYLMLLALLEQKILIHSLRPWMLAAVAESVCALMFPFHWQCPYIPQCPLGLAGVLHAPLPFIAGVDSRYFELYEDPPHDVTCFDLDTATISYSSTRAAFKKEMLPKRPAKQLKMALRNITEEYSKVLSDSKSAPRSEFTPVDKDLVRQRQRREFETQIQDAFLKFIASLMKGYKAFLRPIVRAPTDENATDTGKLFDLEGFLKSREKSSAEFYKKFSETQSFMRFIEERSFVSDRNTYNQFFDDCIEKLNIAEHEGRDISTVQLLEPDTSHNHTTVFIPSPESFVDRQTGKEMKFEYTEFPVKLNTEYFQLDRLEQDGEKVPIHYEASRCSAVRTKPEMKSSLLAAINTVKTNPMHWAKTLLFYSYSLWFMQLESLIIAAPNKKKILRLAFNVLDKMERTEIFPLDQVCYRILIELCGKYDQPAMAVKVLQAMQRAGLEQNAVTYGIYHRAVMDAKWPSAARQKAIRMWSILRHVINAADGFYKFANIEKRRLQTLDTRDADNANGGVAEITVDYEITYHPLDGEDPLGASKLNTTSNSTLNNVGMSPSRAKFLADHSSKLFSSESTPKTEKSLRKSEGWLKGIANSPMLKMIRSTTFESPKPVNDSVSIGSQGSASPSLHSFVHHVKKGYDGVVKDVVPSRFRRGMSSILTKSVGAMGSGMIYSDEKSDNQFALNPNDPAYILDSANGTGPLGDDFWMREVYLQLRRSRERQKEQNLPPPPEGNSRVEVVMCAATVCPSCSTMIYDEEIMSGWKVDDQNLNTVCTHCCVGVGSDAVVEATKSDDVFAPRLKIRIRVVDSPMASFYAAGGLPESRKSTPEKVAKPEEEKLEVAFVSPLVLRRELETILGNDKDAIKKESLKDTHPVVFWNLVYYMRRLGLPSHLFSWIAERHHIRCVFDLPDQHKSAYPLYFSNPNNDFVMENAPRHEETWKAVTSAVQNNDLFRAIQTLINVSRRVGKNGQITLGKHFPIYRDIQFVSLDYFGRAFLRDSLDLKYTSDFKSVPPKISEILPNQDYPMSQVTRACRKIFMPLDIF